MNRLQTPRRSFVNKRPRILVMVCSGLLALSAFTFAKAESAALTGDPHRLLAQTALTGEWTAEIQPSKPGDIRFTFHRRSEAGGFSMNGHTMALGELQGLSAEAASAAKSNVNFNIVREAGTFACEGYFRAGRGAGFWTFAPSQRFAAAMRERGYPDLTDENLLKAAFNHLTTKYVADLKSVGYDRLEFKQLLRAAGHNINAEFVREMQAAGFEGLSMDELVRARNHNINGVYIQEVRAMGFEKQPLEKLIRLRNHQITRDFIQRMRSAGYDGLSIEQLIRLRNHSITPEFVNGLKAEGYADIPPETAIRLKNHEIDQDYVRRVKARGFTDITLEQLIKLRSRDIIK